MDLLPRLLDRRDLSAFERLVAAQFTPLLRRAGDAPMHVRAIDFLADEAREMLMQTERLTTHPARGLARAAAADRRADRQLPAGRDGRHRPA